MKRITPIAAFLVAVVSSSWADLTLEQKMEGGPQNGQIVMRVKGDRFRLDLPGGATGPVSTIIDVKKGDTITLFHQRKQAIKRVNNPLRHSQQSNAAGPSVDPPKPDAKNVTERVGAYEAEVYTMSAGGSDETLWIVKEFPNFEAIKEDLRRVSQASTGDINRAGTLDLTILPGMVVKRERKRNGQKMTVTLTNVTQEALEDSIFQIPADYKTVVPPNLPARNQSLR